MNINIRLASDIDIEAIARLHNDLSEMHTSIDPIHGIGAWNKDEYKANLEKQLEDKDLYVCVVDVEGTVEGYLIVAIKNDSMGHILEIYVNPKYRKNNIGKKLYENGIAWLKEKGIKTVYLYVDSRNETGVKVWENLGFKEYMKKMKVDI